ncbi:enoyl-CoA hydratase/isomerase family protein [Paraburkholderia sediminicola]|nr:enoyl-CoA hydratase/isomerase family protein [Paraburkholderia sediminicola]
MTIEDIHVEQRNGVRTIRLDRPAKRNSLARPHLDVLRELLVSYAKDPSVRCLVITGTGKAFCAGADVDEWAQAEARGELDTYGWTDKAHALVQALAAFPRPTVAAINGSAVGAGTDIGFACDFRIASASASLRCGYTGMGYSPDMGGTWFLPRIARPDVAKRFIFLNERWSAQDACAAGLVSEVIEDSAFQEHVGRFADRLASGPSVAFDHAKALLAGSMSATLAEQLEREMAAGVACGHSEDGQEALRASVEGRAPLFAGR